MRGPRVETRGYFLSSLTGLTLRTADLRAELNPRAILGRPFGAARTGTRGRGWILPASSVPRWRGWPPKAAGGGFEPRNFGQGMQICPTPFGVGPLGLSGIPCSLSTGPPSGSTGDTVSRRGGAWNMSPFLSGAGPAPSPNVQTGTRCHAAGESSPVGTTESGLAPRCIWDHIRSCAV